MSSLDSGIFAVNVHASRNEAESPRRVHTFHIDKEASATQFASAARKRVLGSKSLDPAHRAADVVVRVERRPACSASARLDHSVQAPHQPVGSIVEADTCVAVRDTLHVQ